MKRVTSVGQQTQAQLPLLFIPKMGSLVPNLGTHAAQRPRIRRPASVADALFSTVPQQVLGLLFGYPERSFYMGELIRRVGAGSGAVQREVARLEQSGLITMRCAGTQKHYQANRSSPIYTELCSMARKAIQRD